MSEIQPGFDIFPPTPTFFRQRRHSPPSHRRRKKIRWGAVLYQISFSFFILLIVVLLAGSGWGLSEQALRGGRTRFNIFIILAAYVFMFISAVLHIWSRLLSVKRILKTMPKPYVPTKAIDLPNKVADHIMVEYSRTAVIAHISQATKGSQEGWGKPGTKWENQHFRTYILSTVPRVQKAILPPASYSRTGSFDPRPLVQALHTDPGAQVVVKTYATYVRRAQYAKREPGEVDASSVEKLVTLLENFKEHRDAMEKKQARQDSSG